MSFNIAIDGPAGAGKSTVARGAAKELGFLYVDTGAMYRTIALHLLNGSVDLADHAAVAEALKDVDVRIAYRDGMQRMLLNGEDVSDRIRTEEVSARASVTAAIPCVREKLLDLQRNLAKEQDVLMDGRDIGTNILPDAQLKIYLTASVGERARRRYLELREKGEDCSLSDIEAEIRERDERDMNRETAPLRRAEDAVYLDTSDMDQAQVIAEIVRLAKERI